MAIDKYLVDRDAWKTLMATWTPEKAWWLGVLYGDGNVYWNEDLGAYRVSAVGTMLTLERWSRLIGVYRTPADFKHTDQAFQAYLGDKELAEWLYQTYGLRGKKTLTLVWPHDLPKDLEVHFMRGFWDADGHVTINENLDKRNNKKHTELVSGLTSACFPFITEMKLRLLANAAASEVTIAVHHKTNEQSGKVYTWYSVKWGDVFAHRVSHYLYGNAPEHLRNEDKYKAYEEHHRIQNERHTALCACGEHATMEGRCRACWYREVFVHKTGAGTECPCGKGKPILAEGMCTACYNRARRASPEFQRTVTGTCSCGKPSYRRGMCDSCYTKDRRARLNPKTPSTAAVALPVLPDSIGSRDQVEIWCDYCKETHNPLRCTYESNIQRNGQYICERHGGHLSGSLPKPHLAKTNPYAESGKKQCSQCQDIRELDQFDRRSASWDGYAALCKRCASDKNKQAYEAKKAKAKAAVGPST